MKQCRKKIHSYPKELKCCPFCYKEQKNKYNAINKELIKSNKKSYYEVNKTHLKEKMRAYNEKHIITSNIKSKERYQLDVEYRLRKNLRNRLNMAIKNNQKLGSAVADLGCSIEQLKIYLESKFEPGMTWDNWGINGWHIDHIEPLCSFDLTNRQNFLLANCYKNLRPIWSQEHYKKSALDRKGSKWH